MNSDKCVEVLKGTVVAWWEGMTMCFRPEDKEWGELFEGREALTHAIDAVKENEELTHIKNVINIVKEFGRPLDPEYELPPLASAVYEEICERQEKLDGKHGYIERSEIRLSKGEIANRLWNTVIGKSQPIGEKGKDSPPIHNLILSDYGISNKQIGILAQELVDNADKIVKGEK